MVYCEKKASGDHFKFIYDSYGTMISTISTNKLIFCDIEQLTFRHKWTSELALNLVKYFNKKRVIRDGCTAIEISNSLLNYMVIKNYDTT
ncbi:MAG: hypothetical protein EOP34_02875 [Rickettsiales bacterium]|nr:MAG: hypothetical protein EOP34_02875 [Rickettsiales bacterium]